MNKVFVAPQFQDDDYLNIYCLLLTKQRNYIFNKCCTQ